MATPADETPRGGLGAWRYPVCFALQAVGTITLVVTALPRYQGILKDPSALTEPFTNITTALALIGLSQIGYWMGRSVPPPAPPRGIPALGQVIRFFGRLLFMFVTSVFGFLFITGSHGVEIPSARSIVFVIGLFAIYCFTDQVEQLGRAVTRGRAGAEH